MMSSLAIYLRNRMRKRNAVADDAEETDDANASDASEGLKVEVRFSPFGVTGSATKPASSAWPGN